MVYKRSLYPSLLQHAQTPLVTVLTGMRRTGKTTLIKQLLLDLPNKNSLFFDLQRADIRELFSLKNYDDIRLALISRGLSDKQQMIVALDEIQLLPEITGVIKYLLDTHQIKFIITGSSSYYLKNLFSESLTGRKKVFELFPLSFGEFLTFKNLKLPKIDWLKSNFSFDIFNRFSAYYEEFIRFGGFPQVVLAQTENEKRDLLSDIMSSYINIDIKTLADFADERNYYNLAKLLARRVGSRVELTKSASESGLSRHTVANYISFFEKTYLIATLPVYTHSIDREIVKSKKLYFVDTGLANSLAELSSGAQFENTVFNQVTCQGKLRYYALKTGQEIDFVLDEKTALEVKETPTELDQLGLDRISKTANLSNSRLIGRYRSPIFTNYIWGGGIS